MLKAPTLHFYKTKYEKLMNKAAQTKLYQHNVPLFMCSHILHRKQVPPKNPFHVDALLSISKERMEKEEEGCMGNFLPIAGLKVNSGK